MSGEEFYNQFLKYLKEKNLENEVSGHGIVKTNPDKSKHLETVACKVNF